MARRFARALALLAGAALGCQSYNFSPVSHCIIQPGTERFTLSSVSTADILFVIDDSGSMQPRQENLGQSFATFIADLNATNATRVATNLEPIDFHIAVTTTSVYENSVMGSPYTCQSGCQGVAGNACCTTAKVPQQVPRVCTSGEACAGGYACSSSCPGYQGVAVCCGSGGAELDTVPCTSLGQTCGDYRITYPNYVCQAWGVGQANAVYPNGNFVAWGTNPRVLHFDKQLYETGTNAQGYTQQQLMDFFAHNAGTSTSPSWQGNAMVGICGSGQEQGLQAAKFALRKAFAGQQLDVGAGGAQVAAQWPHPNSKLIVVFVGDEDDCSSPESPTAGITLNGNPGADTCVSDPGQGAGGKLFDVKPYIADYLATLRPPDLLGGGFVEATNENGTCSDLTSCTAGMTGDGTATCGYALGYRFFTLGELEQAGGSSVVAGPVCSTDFGPILDRLAKIVEVPPVLTLPSIPAADEVALLRIADAQGVTRLICQGPAPVGTAQADAVANYDWWFVDPATSTTPSAPSRYVYINHARGTCEANPGETYSADYLGLLPAPSASNPQGGCATYSDCTAALGGKDTDWQCCAGAACVTSTPKSCTVDADCGSGYQCLSSVCELSSRGTCLCSGSSP